MYILAQIFGGIGLFVIIIGMQSKKKDTMLLAQSITNTCFVIQYFLLGAITGAVLYIINTIRTLTFYFWGKNSKDPSLCLLLLFISLAILFGMYTYKDMFSLLPIIGSISTTYGGWQKKSKILRIGMLISSTILIIHDCIEIYHI